MKRPFFPAAWPACAAICIGAAALLMASQSQAQSEHSAITLDPPTGLELQAHAFDEAGNRLADGPANFRRLGSAQAGELADLHTLTLRFAQTVKLTRIDAPKDFAVEQGGSCVEGRVYPAQGTCTLLVRFTPQGPGRRMGVISISHSASVHPMPLVVSGFGYEPVISLLPAQISTLSGSYPANVGLLKGAQNLAIDGGDTLYVADTGNNAIRMRDSSNLFTVIAATDPNPWGVAADSFGEVFFSIPSANALFEIWDYGPILEVSGGASQSCTVTTPCLLSAEQVLSPGTINIDANDTMIFEEASHGAAISQIFPEPGTFATIYDPFSYQTSNPGAFAIDAGDTLYSGWLSNVCQINSQPLYTAENEQSTYSKVAGGRTCGFAGDGGLAGSAELGKSLGQIAFDQAGDMYFADSANQRIRRVEKNSKIIRTVAGNGTAGYGGDGGAATSATLNAPTGVAVDSQGSVYIISSSSATAQVIRKVGPNGFLNFGGQLKATAGNPLQLVVTNSGNTQMVLSGYAMTNTTDFKLVPSSTTCSLTAGSTMEAGQTCFVGIQFTPSAAGSRSGLFRLLSNTVVGFNDTNLVGTGTNPVPTLKITAPASGTSVKSGTAVTFSASVTYTTTPQPTGTVQFKVDNANYGTPVTLSSTGTASTTVTGLTQTSHTLSVTYSGDANYAATGPVSVSLVVTAVKAASAVSLSGIAGSGSCSPVQFLAAVKSGSSGVPTGSVTLFDGTKSLASATLAAGRAELKAPTMPAGKHSFSAHYAGDSTHQPSTSPTLVESGPACHTTVSHP